MRSTWEDFTVPGQEKYEKTQIISYGTDGQQTMHLTLPKNKSKTPLVIFFHGGGMTVDSRELPTQVYNGENAVLEPRYRISPEHKAPAQIEDAAGVIAWSFRHADEYGIDREKIFVGGMSAGAYLAAIAVMNPAFLAPYGLHYRDIAGLLLISGQMSTHFQIKADLGRDNGRYNPLFDEYAPLCHLAPDLPPILMVTGEPGHDIPARPEENAFAAASLKAMGHEKVYCYSLAGHHHGAALDSCDFLVTNFMRKILSGNS